MTFQEKLAEYIEQLDCTAKMLSERSGLSAATISRYRSGDRVPEADSDNLANLRFDLSRCFSAKHYISENSVQNIRRADNPQRLRIIGSKVLFYL